MSNRTSSGIRERVAALIGLKLILLLLLNLIVFFPYQYLQRHQFFPAIVMPTGSFDRMVPFLDWTVLIYLSIYLLMPIAPFLMQNRQQILRYTRGVILVGLLANVAFLFWPTICLRPEVDSIHVVYRGLVAVDKPFHAFPSLHAAFAIYSAACGGAIVKEMKGQWGWHAAFWLWTAAILFATLTTKQHVVVDLLAGSILGVGAYWVAFGQKMEWANNNGGRITPHADQLVK